MGRSEECVVWTVKCVTVSYGGMCGSSSLGGVHHQSCECEREQDSFAEFLIKSTFFLFSYYLINYII